jgi:hypothetical protein
MGFPYRALPPRGAVRLSAPDPFLPFMTSRPAALRTRRSRCPAASRSCSPRGSVPLDRPKATRGRCSLGLFDPLQSLRLTVPEPASRFLPSCAFHGPSQKEGPPGASGPCRTIGLPFPSRGTSTLMRFSTQARSSVSPEVRGARRANPASWNDPCVAAPRRP